MEQWFISRALSLSWNIFLCLTNKLWLYLLGFFLSGHLGIFGWSKEVEAMKCNVCGSHELQVAWLESLDSLLIRCAFCGQMDLTTEPIDFWDKPVDDKPKIGFIHE